MYDVGMIVFPLKHVEEKKVSFGGTLDVVRGKRHCTNRNIKSFPRFRMENQHDEAWGGEIRLVS
jgi:hypothetical protein